VAKSKKITGAGVLSAPLSPEKELPNSGTVTILLFSENKEHEVSAKLAETLIKKNAAKLK